MSYTDEKFIEQQQQLKKINIPEVIKSVCDHSWMNTGMSLQGKSLMVCTKCQETKKTVW